jgi:hypothetical protein
MKERADLYLGLGLFRNTTNAKQQNDSAMKTNAKG